MNEFVHSGKVDLIIFSALLLLYLSSCGPGADPPAADSGSFADEITKWNICEEPDDSGTVYIVAERTELSGVSRGERDIAMLSDRLVVFCQERGSFRTISYESREQSGERILAPPEKTGETVYCANIFPGDTVSAEFWALWLIRSPDVPDSYSFIRYDSTGRKLSEFSAESADFSGNALEAFSLASDGNTLCLLGMDQTGLGFALTLLSGGESREIPLELATTSCQLVVSGGEIYLFESSLGATLVRTIVDGTLADRGTVIPIAGESFWNLPDGTCCLLSSGMVYDCDMERKTTRAVLNLEAIGVHMGKEPLVPCGEDGFRAVTFQRGMAELLEIRLAAEVESDERSVVRILVPSKDNLNPHLSQTIDAFNIENTKYRIDCYAPAGSLENEINPLKFQLELTSENPPDLILLPYGLWHGYARNGVFEDLTPYLERTGGLDPMDYHSGLLNLGRLNGAQIFLPGDFVLMTLVGRTDIVGEEPGWTLREILDLDRRYPDVPLLNLNPESCLQTLLQTGMDEFVNPDEGTCSFERKLFYDLLETAKSCKLLGNRQGDILDVLSGDVLLCTDYIFDEGEYYFYTADSNDFSEGGSHLLSLKGYPSMDGTAAGVTSFLTADNLAMGANALEREGAWVFLEYVSSVEFFDASTQNHRNGHIGFPALEAQLEAVWDEKPLAIHWLAPNENGTTFLHTSVPEFPNSMQDGLRAWFGNLSPEREWDDPLFAMISEETSAYFAGQKTAEDVASVIQSRVQIYLWESR